MLRSKFLRVAAVAPLFLSPAAFGYIRLLFTDASGSIPYNRPDSTAIQFYVNNQIKAGMTSTASGTAVMVVSPNSDPVGAIKFALNQWNSISRGNIKFLPLQTTPNGHDATDYQAIVSFATAQDLSVMGYSSKSAGAIGLTVSALAGSSGSLSNGTAVNRGDIIDSDILLNSSLSFSTDGSTPYDIQAVITHELGHALGLNHNGLYGSTMFPYSAIGTTAVVSQRLLTSDDKSFLTAAYPQGSSNLATISGKIVATDGSPVKAALVTLIDPVDGNSVGTISGSDGTFTTQVQPDSYILYAEPMTSTSIVQVANIISLDPNQVTSNFQPTVLGGVSTPTMISVAGGATVTAPTLTVAAGTNSLSSPYVGFGAAGGSNDIKSVIGINGPKVLPSGQAVDIAFLGGGFDGSETITILGQGISVRAGSLHIDKSVSFSIGPLVRATIDVPARQTSTLASVFVTKPSGVLSFSGYLVVVPPTPTFVTAGVDSAASAQYIGAVSPGGLTAIYGIPASPNLGPTTPLLNAGYDAYKQLPAILGGVSVTFDGTPAPLIFVANSQINLQVPFEVAGKKSTQVVINYNGSSSLPITVPVVDQQPAFFMLSATDPFAANADYGTNPHPNSAQNPAARGSVFSVYGTGIGKVSYDIPTGAGAPGPSAGYTGNYHCLLGAKDIGVPFAGWTPTSVGLAQWSFVIPSDSDTGAVSLQCIGIGTGATTQKATVYIK